MCVALEILVFVCLVFFDFGFVFVTCAFGWGSLAMFLWVGISFLGL